MPPKSKRANQHQHQHQQQQQQFQTSDYETDAPPLDSAPPPRSNDELNLAVLQRHYPEVVALLHVASYAVLYTFNLDSQTWVKVGIEGTLFVCELSPSSNGAERFSVVILNRRGLNNFVMEIPSEEEMEITDEYVIIQGEEVYGLWIFAEQGGSTVNMKVETADKIVALGKQARESREAGEGPLSRGLDGTVEQPEVEASVPMGRQLSLSQLFGQQRAQAATWNAPNQQDQNAFQSSNVTPGFAPTPSPSFGQNDVLGQLFMKAKQDYNGVG